MPQTPSPLEHKAKLAAASRDLPDFLDFMDAWMVSVADVRIPLGEGIEDGLGLRKAVVVCLKNGIDKLRAMNKNLVQQVSPSVVGDEYR